MITLQLTKTWTRTHARWTCRDDRGDGTLSTVIIIAGLVALALILVGVVTTVFNGYKSQIENGG